MSAAPIREELLHAYVDGQVSAEECTEIEHYLATHPSEAERVEAYTSQREILRAAFANVLTETLPETIGAHRLRTPGRILHAAAIVAWLVLGGTVGWALRGHLDAATPAAMAGRELVERARVAHVIYSAETRRAVEVAASQEDDMIRWLSKRMNAAVRVPKLNAFGFEVLGGRLLPGTAGPACQIMYQNAAGKRLTIYLTRDAGRAASQIRFDDRDRVHVVFWSDGTLAFAVSAELGDAELRRIAAAVAGSPQL